MTVAFRPTGDGGSERRAALQVTRQVDEALTQDQCAALSLAMRPERIVYAPYRACLVGAHIDHQGGRITGFALGHGLALGYRSVAEPEVRLTSTDLPGTVALRLDGEGPHPDGVAWAPFVRGALDLTQLRGRGLAGIVAGSLPSGGLSSSAAFSLALLSALTDAAGACLTPAELARAAVRIEHEYVGVKCGLMDPTVIANARANHMVVLDCMTGEVSVEPGPSVAIVAVYSGVKRSLVSTGFNSRTEECRAAAREIARVSSWQGEVTRLGDLPRELIRDHLGEITGDLGRRARHFVTESERVDLAIEAWRAGDVAEFGRCASESFRSSIGNYETGTEDLVTLTEILERTPGVYGARFAGGGFGGFCVAVADPERAQAAAELAVDRYRHTGGPHAAKAFAVVSAPSDGLRWLA
jgi:galactokinase